MWAGECVGKWSDISVPLSGSWKDLTMPRMHFHDPRVVKNEEMDRLFWIAYTDTLILHRDTSIADSLFSSVTILKPISKSIYNIHYMQEALLVTLHFHLRHWSTDIYLTCLGYSDDLALWRQCIISCSHLVGVDSSLFSPPPLFRGTATPHFPLL